jgi:Ca-activated chloride channel family protein
MKPLSVGLLALCILFPAVASAQIIVVGPPGRPIPPRRPIPPTPSHPQYSIREVNLNATVREQAAQVQISQIFKNTGSSTIEATFLFPVPDEAAISGLTLLVDGKELTGKLMKKEEARRIYEDIVRSSRDPALLEYMGQGVYQTSVFPIPANAERTVEIRYTQLLKKDNNLVDMLLPVGAAKNSPRPVETFNVNVRIESATPIKTVYSPTHPVEVQRPDDKHAVCKLTLRNVTSPGDLRLMYGAEAGLVGMNIVSYRPKADEPGYFLLLADPEVKAEGAKAVDKTVVFVIDRSGSMSGEKFKQAKEALKFLVQRLQPGDMFNIVVYDSNVESFRPELQRADKATIDAALGFAEGLYPGGSTNIDGALKTTFAMLTDSSRPNYVLFLTDGLPTVGERNEMKIAANAKEGNKVNARMFNFGVGYDVNSRLLDRLSRDHRGTSAYVQPEENIETHVATLYNKIGSPLLTDLAIKFEYDTPPAATAGDPISRMYPRQLPDLFHGEQLVLVGRYSQAGPIKVTLTGKLAGEQKTFTATTTLVGDSKDETQGFVEKLWATRRIGEIIDELDLKGQNEELVNELVQLSIRHGILTPYTSFLADENVPLADRGNVIRAGESAQSSLSETHGRFGFEQRRAKNEMQQSRQLGLSRRSGGFGGGGLGGGLRSEQIDSLDAKAARPTPTSADSRSGPAKADESKAVQGEVGETDKETVLNIGQKSFFKKNNQWRDSTVTEEQEKKAIRIKQFSKEYFDLAAEHGGELAKYIAFNEPVLVNLAGKTYQIDPPDEEK